MPRIARITAIKYPHHITQRGNNREEVFFDDEDRYFYLDTLKRYAQRYSFDVWAYCLLTNHVHILAVPGMENSLSRGIGGTNLVYTQYINRKYSRSGRLWQNRFFSTIVDTNRYLWAVANYIELNPKRAGMVQKAETYKGSSCRAHVCGVADQYLTGTEWLQASELSEYSKLLKKENPDEAMLIKQATSTGRPLGAKNFVQRLEKKLDRPLVAKRVGRPPMRKQ